MLRTLFMKLVFSSYYLICPFYLCFFSSSCNCSTLAVPQEELFWWLLPQFFAVSAKNCSTVNHLTVFCCINDHVILFCYKIRPCEWVPGWCLLLSLSLPCLHLSIFLIREQSALVYTCDELQRVQSIPVPLGLHLLSGTPISLPLWL